MTRRMLLIVIEQVGIEIIIKYEFHFKYVKYDFAI